MATDQGPAASLRPGVPPGASAAPVVTVAGPRVPRAEEVLTPEAVAFVVGLHRTFESRRQELLARRRARRVEIAQAGTLDFLPETAEIRAADWQVAPAPGRCRTAGWRSPARPTGRW